MRLLEPLALRGETLERAVERVAKQDTGVIIDGKKDCEQVCKCVFPGRGVGVVIDALRRSSTHIQIQQETTAVCQWP